MNYPIGTWVRAYTTSTKDTHMTFLGRIRAYGDCTDARGTFNTVTLENIIARFTVPADYIITEYGDSHSICPFCEQQLHPIPTGELVCNCAEFENFLDNWT